MTDLRKVLDDKSVDAVIVATPDHWHAPATILACDAGKHVYVEKPCSHNIREGRLMVEAARRTGRVVQHRHAEPQHAACHRRRCKLLRDGVDRRRARRQGVGTVQQRRNIGHAKPATPPAAASITTSGSAPRRSSPIQANRLHDTWHWWYDFGTGDMGNDGVHDLDIARWGLGVETHPSTIAAIGGKYFFDDDQQFPDTQTVVFEYPGDGKVGGRRQLIFELRIWSPYQPEG